MIRSIVAKLSIGFTLISVFTYPSKTRFLCVNMTFRNKKVQKGINIVLSTV